MILPAIFPVATGFARTAHVSFQPCTLQKCHFIEISFLILHLSINSDITDYFTFDTFLMPLN